MEEKWKDIKGYEGIYQVSNYGNVRVLDRYVWNHNGFVKRKGKILKPSLNKYGYKDVMLSKDNVRKKYRINRLVAEAFIENPENKEQVNHIDRNKTNNNVNNLEWVTRQENITHSYLLNNENSNMILLKDDSGKAISQYSSIKALSDCTNISVGGIFKTLKNNNIRFEYIYELNNLIPIDLNLNKLSKSAKYYPFALYDKDMSLLGIYTNSVFVNRCTKIPKGVCTKAVKQHIVRYKKRGKKYKNYYYLKKISIADFFTINTKNIDKKIILDY